MALPCVEIKFTWRCRFLTARRSQRGHVIAEKRLSRLIFTQATTTARSRAPSSPPWPRASSRGAGAAAARGARAPDSRSFLLLPRVSFPLLPSAHKEL